MKSNILLAAASVLAATVSMAAAQESPASFASLKMQAERFYTDKSFARAQEIYSRAMVMSNMTAADARWVFFRNADTLWRSQAATDTADNTRLEQAREWLEQSLRATKRIEDRDQTWAEVQESLADFFWTRRNQQNWGAAWPYYQQALEWWAGAKDIETARGRYLGMIWRMSKPPGVERQYSYGAWGNYVPLNVLENALKIAQLDGDKAHAQFMMAMTLRNQGGDAEQQARVPEYFEAALKPGKSTEWYDDALYSYAEWMTSQGDMVILPDGNWRAEPNYPKALELFRRFIREFSKGESRYWDAAQQQIKNITETQISVGVGNIFLPDSEIQYHLNWRNVKQIELALYAVELNRDVKLTEKREDWLQSIRTGSLETIRSWSHDTKDQADHKPGNATLRLDGKLKPGAYLLEVRSSGKSARELILVTDASLVLKSSGKQALVYACNALDGSPLPGAKLKLWEQWYDNNGTWRAREQTKEAGADGIAVFDLTNQQGGGTTLFASTLQKDRQAYSGGNSYWRGRGKEPWKIYAFTDRPAYRPKETVSWKFIARRDNGSVYSTPADETIEFEINDPQGAKVRADKVKLNGFGSAWGTLELTDQMPLGEYHIQFWDEGRKQNIGNATLFRLEEYKLPEFKIAVTTPTENGVKKAFKLGDKVEVEIQADYYFGGPVANAIVELLVHQNPYYPTWRKSREFPWFYEDMDDNASRWNRGYGGGQVLKRETLKTDATGKATLTFDTPRGAGQDFEYRIEARVTDSSRREITGNGNVRVTRQRYFVHADADRNLYRPQDKARVEFRALDANDQPVVTEGTVKVTRDFWWEIWIAPDGKEVKGDELKAMRGKSAVWPPLPGKPNEPGWRLKFRGYERDDILTRTIKTDTNGVAEFSFTPERDGYYRIAWISEDSVAKQKRQVANPIRAETTVWVCSGRTTELGYRHQGVQIIADKDTFRVGNEAPIMIVAPSADRYVLFTVEGEDIHHYRLVHLEGTVKLIDLLIEEKHVPNIFLGATLVSDRQIFADTKQVIVPPTKNFLTLDVKPDRAQYQPREDGIFTITARDHDGKPVSTEVAFGLVDESVFYIQSNYARDPRQFYYGTKRNQFVQTQSTMNQKSYAKLFLGENEALIDERDLALAGRKARKQQGFEDKFETGMLDEDDNNRPGERREFFYGKSKGALGGVAKRSRSDGPTPLSSPAAAMEMADRSNVNGLDQKNLSGGEEPAVVVRSDFRSTILWQPDVKTDANGQATVKVKYPDSLTGWKATARAVSAGNQFGIANATTRTKQPLIVRLQAPRFFVVGDTVTISAVVNNNTDEAMNVSLELDAVGGVKLEGIINVPRAGTKPIRELSVLGNGELRADWKVEVKSPGEVKFKVTGLSTKYSDAMEKTYIAYEHGIEKFISKSGKARGNDITVKLDLPSARKADSTSLIVQITPSLAVTMLDALPYLIDYPYGCTEQTMSRFLPAVITAKTLRDVGLDPKDVMGRVFGGIETNTATATHPKGKKDLAKLDEMTKAGLERLYDFQLADGGWGWWKDGESDHWMTAYVVWGLSLARDAKLTVKEEVLNRGRDFLAKEIVEEEENTDMQAFMLHALGAYYAPYADQLTSASVPKAIDNLWTKRESLNAYTRALLALSAHYFHHADKARILIENLENGVKRDDRPDQSVLIGGKPDNAGVMGTAHWGEDGIYWRWSEGGVEATAFALRALLTIDPQNKLIEPVSNWLIKNRRGAQWSNTRDTAIVVLAMNDYLRVSGEFKPELEYELFVNGQSIARKRISGAEVFNAPNRFTIDPTLVKDANEIRIVQKQGNTPVYFAIEGKFFSLEEPIAAAGNEIFVKREHFKLVGRPTLLKGFVYDREPLRDGESVKSGERVETLITIEGKNNYEYLLFEDLKPAGFEAVEVRSGESLYARELKSGAVERTLRSTNAPDATERVATSPEDGDFTGRQRWVYQELRDRKVALFLDKLPEGVWQIRYDLRAEVPGKFHALPVVGHAMYVPEIRCNSQEMRVTVQDATE
jgi:uncharacterized protein YfaS (alpha-2-macroglobulin family)/tetratricopeptide (TPR) repeat protein